MSGYNKKLHADTYCYARFVYVASLYFHTKTLSVVYAGELGVMLILIVLQF